MRRQWRTKGNKLGFTRKENDNNPRSGVSLDQLHSDQPVLVPPFSGKPTSAFIWFTRVIVEHFSDLIYMQLTIITRQEETLAGKKSFEIWADTFGGKINGYHADNVIFDEKFFRSAIESTNQIIIFCGVGSHHKNAILEEKRKLQHWELDHCF